MARPRLIVTDDVDAEGSKAVGDEKEPPKWWNKELGRTTAEIGRLRQENKVLTEMLKAGGCICTEPAETSKGAWKLVRKLTDRVKELERQNVALLAEIHPYRVTVFLAERGLPEKLRTLIGDQDPEAWYAEYGDTITRKPEGDPQ